MTMPHLMNCDHSETGWCLDCVKTLYGAFQDRCEIIERQLAEKCAIRLQAKNLYDYCDDICMKQAK